MEKEINHKNNSESYLEKIPSDKPTTSLNRFGTSSKRIINIQNNDSDDDYMREVN